MTYEMFKKELKTSLEEKLGSDACITFGKKPMLGETMDTVHIRAEKSNLDYSLSMEALYHLSSVGGLDAEHAADMILEILASIPANRLSLDTGNIICQLMSRSRISTRLDQIPHIPFYDMEITFACVVEDAEIRKSMLIDNEMMEQSHLSLQQLFDLAHRNTFRMFPSRAELLQNYYQKMLLQDPDATKEDFMNAAVLCMAWNEMPPVYRLSAGNYRFGGVAILDNQFLNALAQKENHDLLLLPCTEQEFVVTPWGKNLDMDGTRELAKDALQNGEGEILTRHIFCYRKDTGRLETVD
jgi:hypothetical protein